MVTSFNLSMSKSASSCPAFPKKFIAVALLAVSLTCAAGCGRSVPKEYGMYVYDGRRPIALDRGAYRRLESEAGWLVNFIESTAVDPSAGDASNILGVDNPKELQLLVYFQDLQASNVLMFRTEFDLFVRDAIVADDYPEILKRELYERRREAFQDGMPTVCLNNWLTPIIADMWPYGRTHWQPKIQGGNARMGLFREEAARSENIVDLTVAPMNGTPDAFLLTPKQALSPGVYMLIVTGDDAATVTQGKGGALVRVGPRTEVQALIDAGVESATENLRKCNLTTLAASVPSASAQQRVTHSVKTAGGFDTDIESWEKVSMIVFGPGPNGVSSSDADLLEGRINRANLQGEESLGGSTGEAGYIICRRENKGVWLQSLTNIETVTIVAQFDSLLLRSWRPNPLRGAYVELRFRDKPVAESVALLDNFMRAAGATVWNIIVTNEPRGGSIHLISDIVLNSSVLAHELGDQVEIRRMENWRSN